MLISDDVKEVCCILSYHGSFVAALMNVFTTCSVIPHTVMLFSQCKLFERKVLGINCSRFHPDGENLLILWILDGEIFKFLAVMC